MTSHEMGARQSIEFPQFSGIRCLMMPFIQGDPTSVPEMYACYQEIIASLFLQKGDVGFLTIDESPAFAGKSHRGDRAKYGRALHTEAGRRPNKIYAWGWGRGHVVTLDGDTKILLANNMD